MLVFCLGKKLVSDASACLIFDTLQSQSLVAEGVLSVLNPGCQALYLHVFCVRAEIQASQWMLIGYLGGMFPVDAGRQSGRDASPQKCC